MTLTVITKENPFAISGASSNRLVGLLKGLNNYGVDVNVLILQGYQKEDEQLEFGKSGNISGIKYFYVSRRENITIWQRRLSEYLYVFFESMILSPRINKYLNEVSKDSIVWLQNTALCYSLVKKSKINDFKILVEMNEYPDVHKDNFSQKYIWQRIFSDRKIELFSKNIINRLDGFVLMTETLIQYFKNELNQRTKVLHLPMTVDLDRFDLTKTYEPIEKVDSPYICFVGSMNDLKDGVNILIEAFASVSKAYPNYKLALYGFWTYDTPKHHQRIHDLGIQDKVFYSKPIDSDRVVNLIMNADVLVLPRPDSYQARGGFPTKLGEYLASAKPVIVTPVGEIPKYLTDNENIFFVEQGCVSALIEKLNQVLSDKINANKIGRKGREVAEEIFSKDIQSKRLLEFLESL